jgi:hypothetical protein
VSDRDVVIARLRRTASANIAHIYFIGEETGRSSSTRSTSAAGATTAATPPGARKVTPSPVGDRPSTDLRVTFDTAGARTPGRRRRARRLGVRVADVELAGGAVALLVEW